MVELSIIAAILVSIAAILYIIREVSRLIVARREVSVLTTMRKINQVHEDTFNEIEVDFDFWWSNGPHQQACKVLRTQVVVPDEISEMIGQGPVSSMIDSMTKDMASGAKIMALHVAAHARMDDRERQLIAQLPVSNARNDVLETISRHKREIAQERQALIGLGIDVAAMENHFSV